MLICCGLEERSYQNAPLAVVSLPSNAFRTGTFPQGRKKGVWLRSLRSALGGTRPPPAPSAGVAADGLFQEKSEILHKKRLPHVALVLLWTDAEVPLSFGFIFLNYINIGQGCFGNHLLPTDYPALQLPLSS